MIREFNKKTDLEKIQKIHAANGLPGQCLPDLDNPLMLHTGVVEIEGEILLASTLKGTSELYVIVNHEILTPEERWAWMKELKEYMEHQAWLLGLDQMSAWIPNEIEESFEKRLIEMGFVKSPWSCYTLEVKK